MSASGRLRHAGIAIIVAALAAAITILRPLDITVWSLQSKLFDHQPSGDIVFVTDQSGELDRFGSAINQHLLDAIEQLDAQGARQIIIDTPIRRGASEPVDQGLRDTLERLDERVLLTRAVREDFDESSQLPKNDPFFERGQRLASSDFQTDFLGFVWGIEPSYSDGQVSYPALWSELARGDDMAAPIYPDYSIDTGQIPQIDFTTLARADGETADDVRGKIAVIGGLSGEVRTVKVPDGAHGDEPSTLAHILAAETARRGSGQYIGSSVTVPFFGLLLLLGLFLFRQDGVRRAVYVAWCALLALTFVITAKLGMRVMIVDPLFIGVIYAGLRSAFNFRRRHLYVEARSGLPNFVALQRDFKDSEDGEQRAIVVAKIARLDAIFVSISQAEQGRYLRQIASRLTVGDAQATIYYDGGKYFAFVLPSDDYQDMQDHLEGLRAIASQAISVSQRVLDVSMTIGVDESREQSIANRISSAIAAADQAREAYRPVFIISDFETDSEAWDYSLQARLEDALSKNRISIKLQPQADLRSGLIVGAEALARWVDEERGEIPPSQFILQCERVGRLDDLTRRILFKSLSASRALQDEGLVARISVNVSAIQFVDNRIVDLVEKSLLETKADPSNILIEVTETARIEDFAAARDIMERIGRSGIRFSIDDFGVASANLDALYQLPFSELKIDRMFADEVTRSASACAIVANMVRLSHDMGLTSVVEGIESREPFEKLKELGCDLAQGYYLARPQPFSQLQETLRLQKDGFSGRSEYA